MHPTRRPWYIRLLCRLGVHRWRDFPPGHRESPDTLARRTCERCGVWQILETDPPGWSAGTWRRI